MGEGLNTPLFPHRRSLFFFLALRARSRALADVFEKNDKKNKTTSVCSYLKLSTE